TRGELGPIGEAGLATRETLAAVREAELRTAGRALSVSAGEGLGYPDGEVQWCDGGALTADPGGARRRGAGRGGGGFRARGGETAGGVDFGARGAVLARRSPGGSGRQVGGRGRGGGGGTRSRGVLRHLAAGVGGGPGRGPGGAGWGGGPVGAAPRRLRRPRRV